MASWVGSCRRTRPTLPATQAPATPRRLAWLRTRRVSRAVCSRGCRCRSGGRSRAAVTTLIVSPSTTLTTRAAASGRLRTVAGGAAATRRRRRCRRSRGRPGRRDGRRATAVRRAGRAKSRAVAVGGRGWRGGAPGEQQGQPRRPSVAGEHAPCALLADPDEGEPHVVGAGLAGALVLVVDERGEHGGVADDDDVGVGEPLGAPDEVALGVAARCRRRGRGRRRGGSSSAGPGGGARAAPPRRGRRARRSAARRPRGSRRARSQRSVGRGGTRRGSRRGCARGGARTSGRRACIAAATAGWRSAIAVCIAWATAR